VFSGITAENQTTYWGSCSKEVAGCSLDVSKHWVCLSFWHTFSNYNNVCLHTAVATPPAFGPLPPPSFLLIVLGDDGDILANTYITRQATFIAIPQEGAWQPSRWVTRLLLHIWFQLNCRWVLRTHHTHSYTHTPMHTHTRIWGNATLIWQLIWLHFQSDWHLAHSIGQGMAMVYSSGNGYGNGNERGPSIASNSFPHLASLERGGGSTDEVNIIVSTWVKIFKCSDV